MLSWISWPLQKSLPCFGLYSKVVLPDWSRPMIRNCGNSLLPLMMPPESPAHLSWIETFSWLQTAKRFMFEKTKEDLSKKLAIACYSWKWCPFIILCFKLPPTIKQIQGKQLKLQLWQNDLPLTCSISCINTIFASNSFHGWPLRILQIVRWHWLRLPALRTRI